jgi:hypothetical protein
LYLRVAIANQRLYLNSEYPDKLLKFLFLLPKINTLASVPFRTSSVSPAPIEAEKKLIFQLINEILLFSDRRAEAYKGSESLSKTTAINESEK